MPAAPQHPRAPEALALKAPGAGRIVGEPRTAG
jgi:hypothetical protein